MLAIYIDTFILLEMWQNLFIITPQLHVLLGDIFSLLDVNTDDKLVWLDSCQLHKGTYQNLVEIPHSINVDECDFFKEVNFLSNMHSSPIHVMTKFGQRKCSKR